MEMVSRERCIFLRFLSALSVPLSLSNLALSVSRPPRPPFAHSVSLARIPAGDKNNRLFHYWPLASPKVHYNPECIFGERTAGDGQTKGRKCRHILALSPFPLKSYMYLVSL